jgi:hypothetical protein
MYLHVPITILGHETCSLLNCEVLSHGDSGHQFSDSAQLDTKETNGNLESNQSHIQGAISDGGDRHDCHNWIELFNWDRRSYKSSLKPRSKPPRIHISWR